MIAVGIDIVENERIRNSISDSFLSLVLSEDEIKLANTYKNDRLIQFVAGRFAAKEAIIKCLSDYEIPAMNKLNIINNDKGKPYIKYKNYVIELSISHEIHYATAIAILNDIL